ncbi:LexA DNA binding domain-containing protein [Fictibacillus solisalsi]|uniref:LexA DNA binding domain-containing protein n=1 Tax=Fictibacillus solisalsi TaxID=459525 RepID=A0A1H0BMY3_9BACL|nr:helix-turn-helix domain-containing protein [Fictibacillus solisalsi]SDN46915.1 LexA DNA binding domain-containing protein [Fictibacillus solisalsi]
MHKLSARQQIVLEAIKLFMATNHYPPTVREIAEMVGVTSTNTVLEYLERLRREGLVSLEEGNPRILKIIHSA